ncbi:MAG: hypothetical protein ACP5QT_06525 [Brevinematia bacterium]
MRYFTKPSSSGGKSWEIVGTAGFTPGEVQSLTLDIDSDGTLYVAFRDDANSGKATVMKFSQN